MFISLVVYVVDLSVFPAIADVISDEDAFPDNKLSTSLLYIVDLSAFPVIAAAISTSIVALSLTPGTAASAVYS